MLQPRLYRATWLFGVVAAAVMMFAIVSRPAPLTTDMAPEPFDGAEAAAEARQLLAVAPERQPGSEGDAAAAAFVAERLESLDGGAVTRDSFSGRFDRQGFESENVIYTLPGETEEVVVLAAPRDCAEGPCAASSASATATMLGLARLFSSAHHRKTMMFVSTSGSVAGAAGARQLGHYLSDRPVTAIVVLAQVGTPELSGRYVVPWSASRRGTSSQLVQTAQATVETELSGEEPPHRGTASELVRLAIPAGLGEQSPLVAAGYDAVALSSAGDLPLPADRDQEMSEETLALMGQTALTLTQSLDSGPAQLIHGPASRVPLSGKLVPGWALVLLSAALLVPLAGAALESVVRGRRAGIKLGKAALWVASLTLPFAAAVILSYLLALIRVLPAPAFPFDPARHSPGIAGFVGLVLLAAAVSAALVALYRWREPPAEPAARAVAAGVGIFATGFITWLINPYLALVLMPALHLWLHATVPEIRGGTATRTALVLAGLGSIALVFSGLAAQLGVSLAGSSWQVLLMFTGGHFGLLAAVPPIMVAACLAATLQATWLGWTNMRGSGAQASSPIRPIKHETTQ